MSNVLYAHGNPASAPPPAREGWNHSAQCLVWYEGESSASGQVNTFSIAYYHYAPPFEEPKWIDFSQSRSRQPALWWPLPFDVKNPPTDAPDTLIYLDGELLPFTFLRENGVAFVPLVHVLKLMHYAVQAQHEKEAGYLFLRTMRLPFQSDDVKGRLRFYAQRSQESSGDWYETSAGKDMLSLLNPDVVLSLLDELAEQKTRVLELTERAKS